MLSSVDAAFLDPKVKEEENTLGSCFGKSRKTRMGDESDFILTKNPYHSQVYENTFKKSLECPEEFWAEIAQCVEWSKPWDKVLDNSNEPFTKWYVGGEINACHNAVDRHVKAGNGKKTALIHDSPMTSTIRKVTYDELLEKTSRLAGALADMGVRKGDRVLIYMPLIPETIIAVLATARLGAVHSVVFGGFAPRELATRIDHAEPKVLIAASCGLEPTKGAIEDAGRIGLSIVCAGMAGSVVCGVILDKTHRFKETTLGIYLCSLLSFIVFTFTLGAGSMIAVYLTAALLGFFMTGYLPVGFEFAAELTYPEPEGTSAGLLNAVTQICGIILTSLYRTLITTWGDFWANIAFCCMLGFGAFITLIIPNDLRRQKAKI